MATRRYKTSVGDVYNEITEEVGAATNSDSIELTVDLATAEVNAGGSTRAVSKEEVLAALDRFKTYIAEKDWLPA